MSAFLWLSLLFHSAQSLLFQSAQGGHASSIELKSVPPFSIQETGARFRPGQAIRIYAVGSSNTVYVTWLDQLHLLLDQLGYVLPLVPATVANLSGPTSVPSCEDAAAYSKLHTARIGKPGWASWGFAFEGHEGCNAKGFREIAGHQVRCSVRWACSAKSPEPLKLSGIVEDAAKSDITVLSCWLNDSKSFLKTKACYNANLSRLETASVSIETLRRMVRRIHERNPTVLVVILALYPDLGRHQAVNTQTLPVIQAINSRVREALEAEPNTLFANYSLPAGIDLYQRLHRGHPNCRAGKLIANGVVDALFRSRQLGRGIGGRHGCTLSNDVERCSELSPACCQRSSLCYMKDPNAGECLPYSPNGL